jgi:tripartite motif-containing protein 71
MENAMNPRQNYLLRVLVLTILLFSLTHLAVDAFTPAIDFERPGLSFRHEQTLGESGVPYLVDSDHLYSPIGIDLDTAGNLWVVERDGVRVMKYAADGSLLASIGTAGSWSVADETHFSSPIDIAVDSDGNAWVADGSSARVVKFDSSGNYLLQVGVAWDSGSDDAHLNWPYGVALDSDGNVYVSDNENHRIQIFDSDLTYLATLGEAGVAGSDNHHFSSPSHIFIDERDNLYVADTYNHRVQVFDAGHTYVATLGVSGVSGSDENHLNQPRGVTVGAQRIYVADSGNHRVQVFDKATFVTQRTLGSVGSGEYGFQDPRDVAVDLHGNLYVADLSNHRVQKFDHNLVHVGTFGTTGVPYITDGDHYNLPQTVAVDGDGNIGVVEDEGRSNRFVKLTASGELQFTLGEPGVWGNDNKHFHSPKGLAFDASGNIYIGDCENNRVQKFSRTGDYLASLGFGEGMGNYAFNCPSGLVVDEDGNLYVADNNNHRVQIYDQNLVYKGTLGETDVSGLDNTHFNQPLDVTLDSHGDLYVADTFNHRVQVFDNNLVWKMTLGVPGECDDDLDHFCEPYGVAVDAPGNIYVADMGNSRVQVFDSEGAYLTTIGGDYGEKTGSLHYPFGLDVDSQGNLYIADKANHRIQKFSPGMPDGNW